jgi:hypothetical protein
VWRREHGGQAEAVTRLISAQMLSARVLAARCSTAVSVSAKMKEIGDLVMSGEEALGLAARLEPLHLPLPPSRRLVRVLGAIVESKRSRAGTPVLTLSGIDGGRTVDVPDPRQQGMKLVPLGSS